MPSNKIRPYFKKANALTARVAGPWSVPDLCAAYQWPTGLTGEGVIAIVELGGGWVHSDMQAFFSGIHQPLPLIVDVSVDGTTNSPGGDADGEVALDIQVAAAAYFVATGKPAKIRVYWASDIAPAVRRARADGCDVCSISWGADEADWGAAAAQNMERAAFEAVTNGMVVFAASGDNDSSDGGPTPANVDVPASCPHVIGCGGTLKTLTTETVWNDNPGNASGEGTGGGYSTLFPMPAWQISGGAPHGPGRMVPDVAADADPNTGYEIYFGGSPQVVGGTSAVAPLYAGLFAAFGKKLGFISDKLWSHETDFSDVTVGDNGLYHAQTGPDPCTGLGVPVGSKLAARFTSLTPPPPPPHPTTVTLAEAISWAESALPAGFEYRRAWKVHIEHGLKTHWPATSTPVSLGQAISWAESLLPHASMSRHTVKQLIAHGLTKHWP